MSDVLSLTLPKVRTRSRRRRFPRPPRFTRFQKFMLAWDLVWLVANAILYATSGHLVSLVAMAGLAANIHATVCEALDRYMDARRSRRLALALWLSVVVVIGTELL